MTRRVLGGSIAVTMLAALLAVTSPPVQAREGGMLWFDDFGSDTATFGPNEAVVVYAGVIGHHCDFLFSTADIYIVSGTPSGSSLGRANTRLADVGGGKNTVIGGWGGGIYDELIGVTSPQGALGPGTYSVVIDECQDEVYDADIDQVFENVITVTPPIDGVIPPLNASIAALKASAQTQADAWDNVELYAKIIQYLADYNGCLGGPVACAYTVIGNQIQGLAYGPLHPMTRAIKAAGDQAAHYQGIADDPPDPNFEQLPTVTLTPAISTDSNDPLEATMVDLANQGRTDAALLDGILHELERYQGAEAADDATWALIHAQELDGLLHEFQAHLPETSGALNAVGAGVASIPVDLDAIGPFAEGVRDRIEQTGLNDNEVGYATSLGATPEQITLIEADLSASDYSRSRSEMADVFGAAATGNDVLVVQIQNLRADLAGIIGTLSVDPDANLGRPQADAGGPYDATVDTSVSLSAAGSTDPDGVIATYAWDLDGDGAYDDSSSATPSTTFAAEGAAVVGLQVTDGDGNQDTDVAVVEIGAPGTPPVITPNPADPNVEAFVATSLAFHVDIAGDGPAPAISWTLDGAPMGTGPDLSVGPFDPADIGARFLQVTATNDSSSSSFTWSLRVVSLDSDFDGWHDDVDCAPFDPTINPGGTEFPGNSIDDDCNATTPDTTGNDAPTAIDTDVSTPEDTPFNFRLLGSDPEGQQLTFEVLAPPSSGSLLVNPDGTGSYTPEPDATGTVTFTFRVSDGIAFSAPATATIRIDAVGDDPVSSDASATTTEDIASFIPLTAVDPDADPLTLEEVDGPEHGTAAFDPSSVMYTPDPDFFGTDTFTYRASDGTTTSAVSTVTVVVQPVNDVPTNDFVPAVSTPEDTVVHVSLNPADADGDSLELLTVSAPAVGSIVPTPDGFDYVPGNDVSGSDALAVRYFDGLEPGPILNVNITIDSVPDAPVAGNVVTGGPEDEPIAVFLPATDADHEPLTFTVADPPDHGSITQLIGRQAVYHPSLEFSGADSFTFQVTDAGGQSDTGMVDLTIAPQNDMPAAIDESTTTINNRPVTVDVLANDSDAEGDPLSVLAIGIATDGSAFLDADGRVTYAPPQGFTGTANVPYTVTDGSGSSAATLTVLVTPGEVDSMTWTEVSDFETGEVFNMEQVGPNRLRLVDDAQAFDRVWVAVSSKGTAVKIDADTGVILGEFHTAPDGEGRDPSRTTVDLNGSLWVANRANNSVAHYGLEENGQCVDRNGNGVIDTSTGLDDIKPWPNDGGVDTDGGVETATDECLLHYVKVRSAGTRHLSVNRDNDVWVSGTTGQYFDLIDGTTGEIIREEGPVGYGGYGGLIDSRGIIWSTSPLLRWDTALPLSGPSGGNWRWYGESSYGACLDSADNAWITEYGANIRKFSPSGQLIGTFLHGTGGAQGCTVGPDGDVWVAGGLGASTVSHIKNDGSQVGVVDVGSGPTGVAVDAEGRVWATNYNEGTVSRIDPTAGPVGLDGVTPVGAVDFTTEFLGGYPYNYSDMTGSTLSGAPLSGTWCATTDGGEADVPWAAVGWHATLPGDSGATVRVSTSNDGETFSEEILATNAGELDVPTGRYLRACVALTRSTSGETPILEDLTAWTSWPIPPVSDDGEITTPEDTAVAVDLAAVTDPPGGALSYELLAPPLDGSAILVGNEVTYTPDPNFNGVDSVLFRATGGGLNSNIAAVEFTVTPVNDAPMAAPTSASTLEDTPVDITLLGADVDDDPLTFAIATPPAHGSLSAIDGNEVTYTPTAGYSGPDSFTYTANDGIVASPPATVTLTVTDVATDVPGPPLDVSAIGGNANATVRWDTPATDGGSPITGYEIHVIDTAITATVGAAVHETVVGGLTNGTEYTFEVRAQNANGFGPYSAASNVVLPRANCDTDAFTDVDKDHPFCPEIKWMADNDVAEGFPDGTYRPGADVTRQAMAAFVYRLAGAENGPDPACVTKPFSDVNITDQFCGEIKWMADEGISTGFADGTYRPGGPISRQAMAAFLYRLSDSPRGDDPACTTDEFTDVTVSHPFCGEIDWMVDSGLAAGYPAGDFRPTAAISRQAMAAFLFRYNILTGIVSG